MQPMAGENSGIATIKTMRLGSKVMAGITCEIFGEGGEKKHKTADMKLGSVHFYIVCQAGRFIEV